MQRRKFSREFKLEAVLVKDRGVAVAQAARDLDVHENVLRKWGARAIGRSAVRLSRAWAGEARAAGDRSAAQGSGETEGERDI
jgi:transposase